MSGFRPHSRWVLVEGPTLGIVPVGTTEWQVGVVGEPEAAEAAADEHRPVMPIDMNSGLAFGERDHCRHRSPHLPLSDEVVPAVRADSRLSAETATAGRT